MQQYRRIAKTMNGKASNSYHSPRKILRCKILRRGAADEKGAAVGFAECPHDASCRDEKAWFVFFHYSMDMEISGRGFTSELFALRGAAGEYLSAFCDPWEALEGIEEWLWALGGALSGGFRELSRGVWVHERAKIAQSAALAPPCIVCAGAEVRHNAFVRGRAYVGEGCVVGNATELKNVILLDGAKLPHFNYAGDSIVGCPSRGGGHPLQRARGPHARHRAPSACRHPHGQKEAGRDGGGRRGGGLPMRPQPRHGDEIGRASCRERV